METGRFRLQLHPADGIWGSFEHFLIVQETPTFPTAVFLTKATSDTTYNQLLGKQGCGLQEPAHEHTLLSIFSLLCHSANREVERKKKRSCYFGFFVGQGMVGAGQVNESGSRQQTIY